MKQQEEMMQTNLMNVYEIETYDEKENKKIKNIEKIDNENGIVKYQDYIFWFKADVVIDHIYNLLSTKFPDPSDIIVREINRIDMVIMTKNENIPIEIQSTPITRQAQNYGWNYNSPSLSHFESFIRKQIEENITTYGKCWFFFDAELFRYMSTSGLKSSAAINLTWFRKYIKDELLKVFIIRYDGYSRELYYKDFDWLSEISTCCPIGETNDLRILNRNKFYILYRALIGNKFSKEEFTKYYNEYKTQIKRDKQNRFIDWLCRKERTDRQKLLGYILISISDLPVFNNALDCKNNGKRMSIVKYQFKVMGLFDENGRLDDRFDLLQFFPGYLRKKELWNELKGQRINERRFEAIISGKLNSKTLFWYLDQ